MSAFYGRNETGSTVEWYTDPRIFEALGLRFDLDVCAPPGGVPWVPADRFYTRTDDGLTQPWTGTVWCNPPYGLGINLWLERLADHGDGIALVHARSNTRWFREALARATAVCFIAGGVRFASDRSGTQPPGGSPMPCVLLAYGLVAATAVMRSGLGPCLIVPPGTRAGETFAERARAA